MDVVWIRRCVDSLKFAKKVDLANLKSNVDKLDPDKLKNVPRGLSNLKSKVDKLDVDKLVPVPVDLIKLNNPVKTAVVRKDAYNAKIKNIEDEIPDITNLATKTTLNGKINEDKGETPDITNLATKTALNAKINEAKDEILDITNVATTSALAAVENKIPSVSNLVNKSDFDKKLSVFSKRINSNQTKDTLVENELNELSDKIKAI